MYDWLHSVTIVRRTQGDAYPRIERHGLHEITILAADTETVKRALPERLNTQVHFEHPHCFRILKKTDLLIYAYNDNELSSCRMVEWMP